MKNRKLTTHYLWVILQVSLGVIFIGASFYKIKDPGGFAHAIYNYRLLPLWSLNPIAIVLPWIQLICGVCLLIGWRVRGASLWLVVMLVIFQLAVASALMRGLDVSCGCFESGGDPATWGTFLRDTAILILASLQLWKSTRAVEEGLWWRGT